jgi:hypothetical protein
VPHGVVASLSALSSVAGLARDRRTVVTVAASAARSEDDEAGLSCRRRRCVCVGAVALLAGLLGGKRSPRAALSGSAADEEAIARMLASENERGSTALWAELIWSQVRSLGTCFDLAADHRRSGLRSARGRASGVQR